MQLVKLCKAEPIGHAHLTITNAGKATRELGKSGVKMNVRSLVCDASISK